MDWCKYTWYQACRERVYIIRRTSDGVWSWCGSISHQLDWVQRCNRIKQRNNLIIHAGSWSVHGVPAHPSSRPAGIAPLYITYIVISEIWGRWKMVGCGECPNLVQQSTYMRPASMVRWEKVTHDQASFVDDGNSTCITLLVKTAHVCQHDVVAVDRTKMQ
jgi:hypothetical protein